MSDNCRLVVSTICWKFDEALNDIKSPLIDCDGMKKTPVPFLVLIWDPILFILTNIYSEEFNDIDFSDVKLVPKSYCFGSNPPFLEIEFTEEKSRLNFYNQYLY